MGVIVREVKPGEDLRYLEGPWSNAACFGYMIEAMRRACYGDDSIQEMISTMKCVFDDTTVEEAKDIWYRW